MRILENHGLVWLSKPKTGSTTIRKMLDPYASIRSKNERPYYHHSSMKMIIEDMNNAGLDWSRYHFVLCERNPFTLIPSLWRYSKINVQYQKYWQAGYDKTLPLLEFARFMQDEKTWEWFKTMHTLETYINVEVDNPVHIFQIEEPRPLIDLLNWLIEPGAIPETLPRHNTSSYDAATLDAIREVFSDQPTISRIENMFARSLRQFGYENPWS